MMMMLPGAMLMMMVKNKKRKKVKQELKKKKRNTKKMEEVRLAAENVENVSEALKARIEFMNAHAICSASEAPHHHTACCA